jgi:hypothetical protein
MIKRFDCVYFTLEHLIPQLQSLVQHAQQIVENVAMTNDEIRIQEQLLATEKR